MAVAWLSSGLGAHCRRPPRPHRHQECAAVDLWHALTRGGGAVRVDSVRAGVLLVSLCG